MSVEWIDTTFLPRSERKGPRPDNCRYCGHAIERRARQTSYTVLQCTECLAECHYDAGLNDWTWFTSILTTERGQNGRPTD